MNATAMPKPALTNLQRELLKVFAYDLREEELLLIRQFISDYLMEKAIREADKTWDESNYSPALMQNWLTEKMRTNEIRA